MTILELSRSLLYRKFFAVVVFITLSASACTPALLPPITARPTEQHQPGTIVWHDLVTDDIDRAKEFYGALFGWTFEQKGSYVIVLNNGIPIAGLVKDPKPEERVKSGWWVLSLSINDVDDTADWVREAGGNVIKGPGNLKARGRYAAIADPLGAPLLLLHSATGDPETKETPVGDWLWNELWTTDVDRALDFYQSLGGYAAQQADDGEEDAYWILISDDENWRAGITTLPFEEMPPQWVPVVRVVDPLDVITKVQALGGNVLIKPDHQVSSSGVALIEDPSGAFIMIEAWQPVSRQEEQRP